MLAFTDAVVATITVFIVLFGLGFLALLIKCYCKVRQGQALIRNGVGGTRVSFSGMFVIPVLHRAEYMDISVKRIEIDRRAEQGLICKDNLRADIVVAFFVRVNNTMQDVIKVAQSLGCVRASDSMALVALFGRPWWNCSTRSSPRPSRPWASNSISPSCTRTGCDSASRSWILSGPT